ncbi:MAG: hypothetical protein K5644_06425 [Lachnospiraceae bacterium]|nr:hypothetical protein [Lachnospiraceae bacterium]
MNSKKNSLILYGFIALIFIMIYFRSTSFALGYENFIVYINNYDDGFRAGGLVGAVWGFLDSVTSWDLMSYVWVYRISKIMLVIYYALMLLIIVIAIRKSAKEDKKYTQIMVYLFIALVASMFCNFISLGSFDMYMSIIMLLSFILLLSGKALFLIPILSIVGVLIHPSYLIKCMPLIIVLLLCTKTYKAGKIMGIISLIVSAVAFVLSEVFAFLNPINTNEVLIKGNFMTEGTFDYGEHYALIAPSKCSAITFNWSFFDRAGVNLILYTVALIPFVIIMIQFFRRLNSSLDKQDSLRYKIMEIMGLVIIVEAFFKADFIFVLYFIIMYYILMLIYLNSTKDKYYVAQIKDTIEGLKQNVPVSYVLLIYPMILLPMAR